MPMSRPRIEREVNDIVRMWMKRVYDHLKANPDFAYSRIEMANLWPETEEQDEYDAFKEALGILELARAIEGRWVGPELYYAYINDVDPKFWESRTVSV